MKNYIKETGDRRSTGLDNESPLRFSKKALMGDPTSVLSLVEIAAWQLPSLVYNDSSKLPLVAALRSLQREAVWRPIQTELIWDSIFRGFPIGSLVVSEHLTKQASRPGKFARRRDPWPGISKHHLLDGQQRCDAIALGYLDPFAADADPESALLWLDLEPPKNLPGGTRRFLFRMTTPAHPWGFTRSEDLKQPNRLTASDMRRCRDDCGWKEGSHNSRPLPSELRPFHASVPIPAAWLMLEAMKHKPPCVNFWNGILQRCRLTHKGWANTAAQTLQASNVERRQELDEIAAGIARAMQLKILALRVTQETICADSPHGKEDVSNIEHLFQRLNNGGTPISPEDLRYSIIKAHWPGIEHTIGQIERRPMRASHLALLGARAARVSNDLPATMPSPLSIDQLRKLADRNDQREAEREKSFLTYFGLSEGEQRVGDESKSEAGLLEVISRVDNWLLWSDNKDAGLPAVIRSSIAHSSPDIYLLLMILARRSEAADLDTLRVPLVGLTTVLHWFSRDKKRAVEGAYTRLSEAPSLNRESFAGILKKVAEDAPDCLLPLPSPNELASEIILEPQIERLSEWKWTEQPRVRSAEGDSMDGGTRKARLLEFLMRLRSNRELLLFAQREWMAKRFGDFDKANPVIWDEHNRPWDYDHLLPSTNYTDIRREERYMAVCKEWGSTIANLHILPFEENRSKGARSASASLSGRELSMMLLESESDLKAFDITRNDVAQNGERVLSFVQSARDRLLRIYQDWFATLEIPFLLGQ